MDGVFNFCGTRLFYYFFLSPTGPGGEGGIEYLHVGF
jgi:hypothetical protein